MFHGSNIYFNSVRYGVCLHRANVNPVWCWSRMHPHRAIVNILLQPRDVAEVGLQVKTSQICKTTFFPLSFTSACQLHQCMSVSPVQVSFTSAGQFQQCRSVPPVQVSLTTDTHINYMPNQLINRYKIVIQFLTPARWARRKKISNGWLTNPSRSGSSRPYYSF